MNSTAQKPNIRRVCGCACSWWSMPFKSFAFILANKFMRVICLFYFAYKSVFHWLVPQKICANNKSRRKVRCLIICVLMRERELLRIFSSKGIECLEMKKGYCKNISWSELSSGRRFVHFDSVRIQQPHDHFEGSYQSLYRMLHLLLSVL